MELFPLLHDQYNASKENACKEVHICEYIPRIPDLINVVPIRNSSVISSLSFIINTLRPLARVGCILRQSLR
jgi:hypothetical protein